MACQNHFSLTHGLIYLKGHSIGGGCASIHGNNRLDCPAVAIPPSEAEEVQAVLTVSQPQDNTVVVCQLQGSPERLLR